MTPSSDHNHQQGPVMPKAANDVIGDSQLW